MNGKLISYWIKKGMVNLDKEFRFIMALANVRVRI